MPTTQELAKTAQATYNHKTPDGYSKIDELSSNDIHTYKHDTENHHIIAHRGTDLHADTAKRDLKTDLRILLGKGSHTKVFKDRVKETEKIVKTLKEKDPDTDIHLTGHSLGGSTAQNAMIKSKVVRDGVTKLDTFNAGTSPLQTKGLAKTNPAYKEIARKATHHRIDGDDISGSAKVSLIGSHKTYKTNAKPSIAKSVLKYLKPHLQKTVVGKLAHFGADRIITTLGSHSLSNFTKSKPKVK
tara:strand:- start:163 stop:891 length:729 start_codon:yes stop_codon:yes gene_type:complete